MKRKLARKMLQVRERAFDMARASLARKEREIESVRQASAHAKAQLRALHASVQTSSTELERAHLRCQHLEQKLQQCLTEQQIAKTNLVSQHHRRESGKRVLERVEQEHRATVQRVDQREQDERSQHHRKRIA